jgi:hypothetical protein
MNNSHGDIFDVSSKSVLNKTVAHVMCDRSKINSYRKFVPNPVFVTEKSILDNIELLIVDIGHYITLNQLLYLNDVSKYFNTKKCDILVVNKGTKGGTLTDKLIEQRPSWADRVLEEFSKKLGINNRIMAVNHYLIQASLIHECKTRFTSKRFKCLHHYTPLMKSQRALDRWQKLKTLLLNL